MKKIMFVIPIMAVSLLASCFVGGGGGKDKVQFMLSSDQQITVVNKTATVYVDWTPTDIIKFESFTFTATPSKSNTVSFDQTGDPRPMPVSITFEDGVNEDINGTLSFTYEDVTTKTKGNSSVNVTINKPQLNPWYTYEDWWNYCSNGNDTSEATSDDILYKEIIVNVNVNGLDHKVRLIDVDHINAEGEEPEAHCTFEFMNVITDSNEAVTTTWNNNESRPGEVDNYNFPFSTLNNFLNDGSNCILKQLPLGLQRTIKEVSKKVGCKESYVASSYQTKLFPLAHDEMFSHAAGAPSNEGLVYLYYITHPADEDRIKKKVDSNTEDLGESYWLRSPYTANPSYAWNVNQGGDFGNSTIEQSLFAVAPAFCI